MKAMILAALMATTITDTEIDILTWFSIGPQLCGIDSRRLFTFTLLDKSKKYDMSPGDLYPIVKQAQPYWLRELRARPADRAKVCRLLKKGERRTP